jgi:hypothetical protein
VRLPLATRLIVGFQHKQDADRFLADLVEGFVRFGLSLKAEKTRLIEFGRLLSVFGPLEVEIIVDGAVPAELLADYSRAGMRFIVAEARGESPPGVGLLVD